MSGAYTEEAHTSGACCTHHELWPLDEVLVLLPAVTPLVTTAGNADLERGTRGQVPQRVGVAAWDTRGGGGTHTRDQWPPWSKTQPLVPLCCECQDLPNNKCESSVACCLVTHIHIRVQVQPRHVLISGVMQSGGSKSARNRVGTFTDGVLGAIDVAMAQGTQFCRS